MCVNMCVSECAYACIYSSLWECVRPSVFLLARVSILLPHLFPNTHKSLKRFRNVGVGPLLPQTTPPIHGSLGSIAAAAVLLLKVGESD